MGWDYAFVHLFYTVPPAVLLHFLFSPVRNRRDVFKIGLLSVIAFVSTTPWDSYLIRTHVWSYTSSNVLGIFLFSIPIEECFFFVIQTYITSILYLLLSKPIVHSTFLISAARGYCHSIGVLFFALVTGAGAWMAYQGTKSFYLGVILTWAGPFLTLLTALAGSHLNALPLRVTLGSIVVPTAYLWLVDSLALRNGTWTIEEGTKLDWQLWGHLDIEEAVFFLVTNMLIVFGLVACDKAFAVMDAFPWMFPSSHNIPSARAIVQAVSLPSSRYDMRHLEHLQVALSILQAKSRSFYFASMVFPDRCRLHLLSLYAFCRIVDDLVDDAPNPEAAHESIEVTRDYLDLVYSGKGQTAEHADLPEEISTHARAAFVLLTTLSPFIPAAPLRDLLSGFRSDLAFSSKPFDRASLPIQTEADLGTYCERVASTVAQMFVHTTWHCDPSSSAGFSAERTWILARATEMGVALQLVNIARDIVEDARNGRVYIPVEWFAAAGELDHLDALLGDPGNPKLRGMLARYALRLVRLAKTYYADALPGLNHLPRECSRGARLAIEVYMDIGREIERRRGDVRERVVVNRWAKLFTAFKVLYH